MSDTTSLDLTAYIIDVRDIIARIEELESSKEDHEADPEGGHWSDEEGQELSDLTTIMEDLKGSGGDEQWRGGWYPVTLIADVHFETYAQELVEDIGDLPSPLPSYIAIDWEATARNIRMDYTSVEIGKFTYYYR